MRYYLLLILFICSNTVSAIPKKDSLLQLVWAAQKEDTILCKQLQELSEFYIHVNLDSALQYTQEMKMVAENIQSDYYQEQAIFTLALVEQQRGKMLKADSLLKLLINKNRDTRTPGKYLLIRAQIHLYLDQNEKALEFAEQALEGEVLPKNENRLKGRYHSLVSRIYERSNQMSKAFEHRQQAYEYALKRKNDNSIAWELIYLARFYKLFEDYEQFKEYLEEAKGLAKGGTQRFLVHIGLLESSIELGNAQLAHQYFQEASKLREQLGRNDFLDFLYYMRSQAFLLENKLDSAYYYASEGLKIAESNDASEQIAECNYALGLIKFKEKKYAEAISYYEQSINGYSIRPYKRNRKLATAYAKVGDWKAAYNTLQKSNEQHDTIFDKKALLATNSNLLANRFELEQERQKLITENKEAIYQAQITRQHGMLGFASFMILTLAIGIFLLNKWYREKKKSNALIAAQKEDLQQANDIKSKIFYVLGHDLRGPVGNIDTMFSEILKGTISLSEFKELLPYLKKNTAGVSLTLNNILHWGLAQTKQLKVVSEVVNIQHEVGLAKALLEGLMQQKRIAFVDKVQEDLVVKTDNAKLNLIIRNLIANSIKYTPPEGKIEVRTATTEEEIIISVSDSGIGMSPEIQAQLFENPISQDGTRQEKGTGIGLNLCKQMLEEMGGRIWAESILNQGSTFFFALPTA